MTASFIHRHPLEDHISGFEAKPNPNHLAVLRRPVIFSVLVHKGHETQVAGFLRDMADASARFCGPSEWLVVSELSNAESLGRQIGTIAGTSAIDQSDGHVLLRVSGPSVRRLLAKCVAVDLHPDAFKEGHSANVLCCHVSVNLSRVGPDSFELVVARSFAGAVFEELMEMGREFALTYGFTE